MKYFSTPCGSNKAHRTLAAFEATGNTDVTILEHLVRREAKEGINDGYTVPDTDVPFRSHGFDDGSGIVWVADEDENGKQVWAFADWEDTTEVRESGVRMLQEVAHFGGQHAEHATAALRAWAEAGKMRLREGDRRYTFTFSPIDDA